VISDVLLANCASPFASPSGYDQRGRDPIKGTASTALPDTGRAVGSPIGLPFGRKYRIVSGAG
jgi:hypothetical protein